MSWRFFSYKNVVASGSSAVSAQGGGLLHGITINRAMTAAALATVYDNTSNNSTGPGAGIIGTIDMQNTKSNEYLYNVFYRTGLTIDVPNVAIIDLTFRYS